MMRSSSEAPARLERSVSDMRSPTRSPPVRSPLSPDVVRERGSSENTGGKVAPEKSPLQRSSSRRETSGIGPLSPAERKNSGQGSPKVVCEDEPFVPGVSVLDHHAHQHQKKSETVIVEVNPDGEDSDSDDESVDDSQKKSHGSIYSYFKQRRALMLMAFIGLVLIATGIVMYVVLNDSVNPVARGVGLIGVVLVSGILGEFVMLGISWVINLILKLVKTEEAKYDVTVFAFYVAGVSTSLSRFWWTIFCIIGLSIITPPTGSNIAWDTAFFYLVRIFGIIALLHLSRAMATICRTYIAQDFGTRSYQERVQTTFENQRIISVMTMTKDPVFWALFELSSHLNTQLHPEDWQRMMRYINNHHVNGAQPKADKHVPSKPGADDGIAQISRPVSSKVFKRIYGLVLARRALQRAEAEVRAARQDDDDTPGLKRRGSDTNVLRANNLEEELKKEREETPNSVAIEKARLVRMKAEIDEAVVSRSIPSSNKAVTPSLRRESGLRFRSRKDMAPNFRVGSSSEISSQSITSSTSMKGDKKKIYKEEMLEVMDQLYGRNMNNPKVWDTVLDPRKTGYISSTRFRKTFESMFRDRYKLSLTLQDSQTVLGSIDTALMSIFTVLVALIGVGLFSSSSLQILASLATAVLAWSFVFGPSVASSFENIIFLFGVHPYDVGDKIKIGEDRYEVLRIRLLTTDLLRADGAFLRLENKRIPGMGNLYNYSTSKNHGNGYNVYIPAADVNPNLIQSIRNEVEKVVARRPTVFEGFSFTAREMIHPLDRGSDISLPNALYATHVRFYLWLSFAFPNNNLGNTNREQSEFLVEFSHILSTFGVAKPFIYNEKDSQVKIDTLKPIKEGEKEVKQD